MYTKGPKSTGINLMRISSGKSTVKHFKCNLATIKFEGSGDKGPKSANRASVICLWH